MKLTKDHYHKFVLIKKYFNELEKQQKEFEDYKEKEIFIYEKQILNIVNENSKAFGLILDYLVGDINLKQLRTEIKDIE